jgi:hypothetical protein
MILEVINEFDIITSVNTPVPTGYEKPGPGLPEREKLICYLLRFVLLEE